MSEIEAHRAYISARVKGMRSVLFTRERYEEFLEYHDSARLVEALLTAAYEREMAESLTRHQGADAIEDAVSRNMVNTFDRLRRMTQDRFRELADIFFARWDLAAAKALLRARHHGLGPEEASPALFPGPSLGVALLEELAAQPTMETLVERLSAWNTGLCRPLRKVMGQYNETRDITILEEAIDRRYFVENARALAGAEDEDAQFLRHGLRMEIDRINVRMAMALRSRGESVEALEARILAGGLLPAAPLHAMVHAASPEEALEALGSSAYSGVVKGLYTYIQTGRFSSIERLFEMAFMTQLQRMARTHVLSFAVLMHYTWLKFNETVNLRLIARGEANHLPKGRIQEELLYAYA